MEQYIKKSTVVAEINRIIDNLEKNSGYNGIFGDGQMAICGKILSFLDTLEVKELLTWQDIRLISEIGEDFMNSQESDTLNEEEYYTEILNRFKAQKGEL